MIHENMGNTTDHAVKLMMTFQTTGQGFDAVWPTICPAVDKSIRQLLKKRLVSSPDAADEVTQMVVVDLLEVPGKGPKAWFDPTKSKSSGVDGLNAWLYGFVRNAVKTYCDEWHNARQGRKVVSEAALPLNELGEAKSIMRSAVAKIEAGDPEAREIVNECVDALPEECGGLLRLQMAEDLSVRALSHRTGIHTSTVQRQLTKARVRLRKSLESRGIDTNWFLPA